MTDYEAVKAGAKEAITEWLETPEGHQAIAAGARSAVLNWIELTAEGAGAITCAAERAVTDWLKSNETAFLRALVEAVSKLDKPAPNHKNRRAR